VTITSDPQTGVTPETDKHAALALACYLFGPEQGSHLLRRALTAEIIADRNGVSSLTALDLAMHDAFDPRVREAGKERDRLIRQAERAFLAAEQDGEVA
jgi:hypothetical protein